jgi:hypothetical protein
MQQHSHSVTPAFSNTCIQIANFHYVSESGKKGRVSMLILLKDLLLFGCLAAFITGIIIAFATLLS